MTITANDIKLLASARMVDADDGGGPMTGTGLQDGLENNVFPDISSTDRAFGRLALRKVWPAVLNSGTDTLLGAHVILDDMPDDAAVRAFAFLGTSATEDRAAALARLQMPHWAAGVGELQWAGTPHRLVRIKSVGGVTPVSVGSVVMAGVLSDGSLAPVVITGMTEVLSSDGSFGDGFGSLAAGDRVWAVTLDGTPGTVVGTTLDPNGPADTSLAVPAPTTARLACTRPVTGTLASGATYCDVDTLLASVVPRVTGGAAGSAAQIGIDAAAASPGVAVAFRAGDGLVVHHTGEVAAATYANGNTVNVGRTNISNFRLVGANGVGITTGWTGNPATGVVTISDISGWAQPVRVRHTIEEVLACARTGYPEVSGGSSGSGTSQATAPVTLSPGLTMYCGRPNVGSIRVISRAGQDITLELIGTSPAFEIELGTGTVSFQYAEYAGGVFNTAFITSHSPVTLVSSGSYAAVSAASAPGGVLNRITFNRPLTRAFPAGTMVSSMLLLGDLQARSGAAFSQEAWTGVWADSRIGSAIAPQYQDTANPIVVTNRGAISERWAVIFTTATSFRLVGQTTGQIATGDVNSVLAPVNPATGSPYFTLQATGWGTWAAGNVLRFNTYGANAPVWVARAVLPSAPSSTPDSLTVAVRGDIDA